MKNGIGGLRDDEVALISNLIERTGMTRDLNQQGGAKYVTFLTHSENEMVWRMGMIALSSEAGRDNMEDLKRRAFLLEMALREIVALKVGKNKGDAIREIRQIAADAISNSGEPMMFHPDSGEEKSETPREIMMRVAGENDMPIPNVPDDPEE